MQQDPVQDVPITRDEAVAKLKYDWVDSRKAKLLQLANVWKMWNQVSGQRVGGGASKYRQVNILTFRLC